MVVNKFASWAMKGKAIEWSLAHLGSSPRYTQNRQSINNLNSKV